MSNPYKCVMAIDPGGTSGVAVRGKDGSLQTWACIDPHELYTLIDNAKALEQIVIENFQAQLIGKYGLHTVRIVGAVEALAFVRKIGYKVHMPVDRYPFKKEARLLLKGRHVVIHEFDAVSHLLRWEYDNGIHE